MDFESWCKENGFDAAALSEPQKKKLLAAWKADVAPPPDPDDPPKPKPGAPSAKKKFEDAVAAAEAEDARVQAITEIGARVMTEDQSTHNIQLVKALGDQAIQGKWDTNRFELELLRARRPTGPGIAVMRQPEVDDTVIEAAVCKAAGLPSWEKRFPQRALEAVDKFYPRGMGLQSLVSHYARRGGFRGDSVRDNLESAWRAAKRATDIQAVGSWGPSTQGASIGSMLANVANKFFREAFDSIDSSWREIAATRTANDFKQISTYSLTGDLTFKKLPPGGEIQHGQVDAVGYTNQLDSYARMLGLDRRDLINDDISAFSSIARRIGRGGAIALNKLFWGIFLNNASFFTAGRNNVSTGAGSALSLAGLDAANQKAMLQTDPDGNILGTQMRILLVPPALSVTAQTLMSSTMLVSGATTAPGTPSQNIWAGKFRVVTSPYMQDSTLTGNSAAAWYLLSDPSDLPVIEVAALNGQFTPTVETSDSDFGMLGQAFRGYMDIGVALQEYRGGVRSAGS